MKKKGHVTEEDKVIGHNLKRLRLDSGMTQVDLAAQIGVTFQQLQKYETGANRIAASRLLRIANALNVKITSFYDGLIDENVDQKDIFDIDFETLKLIYLINEKDNKKEILESFIAQISDKN